MRISTVAKPFLMLPFLLMFLLSVNCMAQHSERFGDYEVFCTVLNSTFIKPEIAARYGITRAKDSALINVAISKDQARGEAKPQSAVISGKSFDLIHTKPLEFKEYREGDAIYYIAELRFRDRELRSFTIDVQPEMDGPVHRVKFNQTLYFDE